MRSGKRKKVKRVSCIKRGQSKRKYFSLHASNFKWITVAWKNQTEQTEGPVTKKVVVLGHLVCWQLNCS